VLSYFLPRGAKGGYGFAPMPNAVRAYLLSVLVRQHLLLKNGFAERYPGCWLVWEPGNWTPAGKNPHTMATQRPSWTGPREPVAGDALCFELALAPGTRELKVGRGPPNDIEVNDLTVSREHLNLSLLTAGGWVATAVSGSTTLRNGVALPSTELSTLKDRDQLGLGSAHLTYYDLRGFAARLVDEAKKLPRSS
jgi:hypothetical protein